MQDQEIVNLYWARDERAIDETSSKYGDYCFSIASSILKDHGASEECVSDTWFQTWKTLPPKRPAILPSYLGTITRNLAISRYRASSAMKRRTNRLTLAYEELEESVPNDQSPEELVSARELGKELSQFLRTIPQKDRCIFVRRYWYMDSIAQISQRYGIPQGTVKAKLHRIRQRLKVDLQEAGYSL